MALEFMRRHRRWLFIFLWLVIGAFIILYIPAFQGATAGSPAETLGRVGSLPITVGEFQKAYLRQRQLYERLYQGRLNEAILKNLGLDEQVFQSLVAEKLMLLEARRLGLSVGDAELARSLAAAPDLQLNGRFMGVEELKRRLQGASLPEFEETRRLQLLTEKLEALVTDGVGVSAAEAEREFRRRNEQIRAEYVLLDASRHRDEAAVSEDEIRVRFEAKKESYRIPEKRVVSYLLLDAEALRSRVTVTDREIEAYFQQHRDDFKEEEQVCASHILVKVKQTPDAKEGHAEEEARKIAQGLLEQVKKGVDFAKVAKTSSEDKGSAENGGDVGCSARGRWVKEFDDAAFALEPGKISDLVRSPFGYHVIRVASRKEEAAPALSQVQERLRQTLLGERVRALIEEKVVALSESLQRGRSLEEAAREHGINVQRSAPMARGEAVEPIASAALASRAFELKRGEVDPEPFALSRGVAFIGLAEAQPSRLPELKEIRDKVKADIVEEKALERSRVQALELKSRAKSAGLEAAARALGLLRKETPALVGRGQAIGDLAPNMALEEAAFTLPEKTLSDPVRAGSGYAILRVLEKKAFDREAFEKQKASLTASLRDQKRSQLFQAYLNQARQRFHVERRPEVFRRVVG